jgi:hypothetical protein
MDNKMINSIAAIGLGIAALAQSVFAGKYPVNAAMI